MEYSIPLIFFCFIIFPGYLFFSGYHSIPQFSTRHITLSPFNIITYTILPTFLIHLQTIYFVNSFSFICNIGSSVDLQLSLDLLTGNKEAIQTVRSSFKDHLHYSFIYGAIAIGIGFFEGLLCWILVRYYKIDVKVKFLRYPNRWYYILTGEYIRFPENLLNLKNKVLRKAKRIGVLVQAQIKSNDGDVYYNGLLESFHLSRENIGVEYLKLSNAIRTKYDEKGEFLNNTTVNDSILVLPIDDIKNFMFSYFEIKGEDKKENSKNNESNETKLKYIENIFIQVIFGLIVVSVLCSLCSFCNPTKLFIYWGTFFILIVGIFNILMMLIANFFYGSKK